MSNESVLKHPHVLVENALFDTAILCFDMLCYPLCFRDHGGCRRTWQGFAGGNVAGANIGAVPLRQIESRERAGWVNERSCNRE